MTDGNRIRKQAAERRLRYINGMPRGLVAPPDNHVLEVIGRYAEGVVEGSQPRAAVLVLIEQGFVRRKRIRARKSRTAGAYMLVITTAGRMHLARQKHAHDDEV